MPLAALTFLLYLVRRRLRPTTIALLAYETWQRLPPEQRQRLLLAARRHGPRMASSVMQRRRRF